MCMAPCVVLVCVASVSALPGYVRCCVGIFVSALCVYITTCVSVCDCVLGRVNVLPRVFVMRVCCMCACVGGILIQNHLSLKVSLP
jgi:hypothetical protein